MLSVAVLDEKGNGIPDSLSNVPFQIDITPAPLLFVKVPSTVAVSVDGASMPPGPIDGAPLTVGQHALSVPNIVAVNNDTRLKFDRWSDGLTSPNRTALAESDIGLEAAYVTQHPLILDSSIGTISGGGWYDSNASATVSVTPTYLPMDGPLGMFGSRIAFQGWYENGNMITSSPTDTISMNQAHMLTASWQPDYTITEVAGGILMVATLAFIFFAANKKHAKSA